MQPTLSTRQRRGDKLPKATIEAFLRPPPRFDTELLLNVAITLTPVEDGYRTLETRADEAGAFVFEDITPGTYRLYCQGNGVESDPVLVDVIAGSVIELGEILLVPLVGTIRGTGVHGHRRSCVWCHHHLLMITHSTIADAEGRFTLQVYAGRRILTIANPDHFTWASAPISWLVIKKQFWKIQFSLSHLMEICRSDRAQGL